MKTNTGRIPFPAQHCQDLLPRIPGQTAATFPLQGVLHLPPTAQIFLHSKSCSRRAQLFPAAKEGLHKSQRHWFSSFPAPGKLDPNTAASQHWRGSPSRTWSLPRFGLAEPRNEFVRFKPTSRKVQMMSRRPWLAYSPLETVATQWPENTSAGVFLPRGLPLPPSPPGHRCQGGRQVTPLNQLPVTRPPCRLAPRGSPLREEVPGLSQSPSTITNIPVPGWGGGCVCGITGKICG